jgi:Fuc2NAc and GlcNAc transferase
MFETVIFIVALVLTAIGIAVFKRMRLAGDLLDIPNERSSHETPKPRGAGIVIVAVTLLLYGLTCWVKGFPVHVGYVFGGVMVATVSWVDDRRHLPAGLRLLFHFGAALAVVLSGVPSEIYFPFAGNVAVPEAVGTLFMIAWIVWMTNAYNFMDGIDGIAGTQAVVAGLAWFGFGSLTGGPVISAFGGVLAFSAVGFLLHNWSPASVFMGDVGSAFLGYTFATMPLLAAAGSTEPAWSVTAAISFLWVFLFDTLFTFLRRLIAGERVWEAHRQHLYQRMILAGWRHSFTATFYGVIALLVVGCFFYSFIKGTQFILPAALLLSAGLLILVARGKKH